MNFKLNDDFEVIDLGIQELDVYDIVLIVSNDL